MKKLLLFSLAVCLSTVVLAQKVYFIYLQTDDQSPFYVRVNDKIYSSAASGFLILPNLSDSTYSLSIGFAKSQQPEAKFSVTINQSDKGFLVKKLEDGLALFDLQNMAMLKSSTVAKDNNTAVYETRTDNFSSLLSKAADDPALLKVPVGKKEEAIKNKTEQKEKAVQRVDGAKDDQKLNKEDTVATTATEVVVKNTADLKDEATKTKIIETETKTDTTATQQIAKETVETVQPISKDNSEQTAEYKPSVVKRHSESSTTEGFGVVYVDKQEDKTDTIRILIPPSKNNVAKTETDIVDSTKKETELIAPVNSNQNESKLTTTQTANVTDKITEKKTTCKGEASDKDFLKLRKNMAAKDNDEAMINEAKKLFKTKCLSVEQIRYLSSLFLTSAAKYQFFDAAYKYVSDKNNFVSLQTEIKDEYYLKRFKALIGE